MAGWGNRAQADGSPRPLGGSTGDVRAEATRSGRVPSGECALVTLIVLLGFALRVYALDRQSFWSDEGLTVHYIGGTVADVIQRITVGFHNPLYFTGLHFWAGAAGTSDWAIRYFSVVCAVLAIPLIYVLGRHLYGRTAGLVAALLLAANPFAVYYAQEARMYTQILALSLGVAVTLLLALRRNRPLYWLGFVLFSAGCLYTHYFAALGPAAAAVYYVLSWLRGRYRPLLGRWLLAQIAVVVLYVPWLANALGMTGTQSWQEPIPAQAIPWHLLTSFALGEVFPFAVAPWLAAAFALLFLCGCLAMWLRRAHGDGLLLPALFFVPLLTAMGLAAAGHGILDKYLTVALAPFCLILALGILLPASGKVISGGSGLTRALRVLIAVVLCSAVLAVDAIALHAYYTDARTFKPDYRATAATIAARERPGDVILADGIDPDIIFERYYSGSLPIQRVDLGEADEEEALLAELTAAHERAWLVLNFHEPGRIEHWLETHGFQVERDEFSTVKLYLYDFPTDAADGAWLDDPAQTADRPARLARYRLTPSPVRAGAVAHLSLVWQVTEAPGVAYKVSVRLSDARGTTVWAWDRFPIAGIVPSATWQPGRDIADNLGVTVPAGTLPGDYTVSVVLYEAASGRRVVSAELGPLAVIPCGGEPVCAPPTAALAWLGEAIELAGADVPGGPLKAGDEVTLFVLWHAIGSPPGDADAVFRLARGNEGMTATLTHDAHPLSAWRAGELVRYPYTFRSDPALSTGRYTLTVELVDRTSGAPLGATPAALGTLDIRARMRSFDAPRAIAHPLDAQLSAGVRLLGYELSTAEATPGDTVTLTLYWQALVRMDANYTVFTHLLTPDGQLAAGKDTQPLGGEAPTTSWLPGEYLTDRYEWTVPAGAAPGAYAIEVGMYDPVSGRRLPVTLDGTPQPGDRVLLDAALQVQ